LSLLCHLCVGKTLSLLRLGKARPGPLHALLSACLAPVSQAIAKHVYFDIGSSPEPSMRPSDESAENEHHYHLPGQPELDLDPDLLPLLNSGLRPGLSVLWPSLSLLGPTTATVV
ncbi:hypothetical protein KI387_013008, partial [Taxus chinensis]